MAIRALLLAIVFALYPLAAGDGCGGKSCGTIEASDYDQSCSSDSDCLLEPDGNFCQRECACVNTAINAKDQARYEAVLAIKISGTVTCPCPGGAVAACNNGTCGLGALGALGQMSDGGD
jgi:hypothetical protein